MGRGNGEEGWGRVKGRGDEERRGEESNDKTVESLEEVKW